MKTPLFLAAAMIAAVSLSCAGANSMEKTVMGRVSDAEIGKGLGMVSGRKIFFGHQSVGWNILDGLKDIGASSGGSALRFVETRSAGDISGPGFYHAPVGSNFDPLGKLRDFDSILRGGVGRSVDAAFLKFCYVDITATTDVDALFNAYRDTLSRLRADFPDLALVHFTAPLTARERGWKTFVKRMIGRKTSDSDNAAREAYNRKLRAEYGGKAPVFDLALIEASDDDGAAAVHSLDGAEFFALRAEYTDDGGHLNAAGRRRAAGYLAVELGNLVR